MWRIFPLDIFSAHLSCGEISPRDRFSPPFSCGEIFHLTDLSPHFSCGEISPCDRVSPHLSSGEFSHLTCHGENFSTWPIFSPQTASVASVTNIRYVYDIHAATCISDAVFKEKRQKITPKSKPKQEFVALIFTYYDVSSMETPRIYQEDLFYQSKAL